MKRTTLLTLAICTLAAALPAQQQSSGNTRTWHDNKGRELVATFRGIKDDNIFLQTTDGNVHRIALANLSAADQAAARTLKIEGLGIPMDPGVAQAAAAIDKLVLARLQKADQHPNALASDEQFIRRVYLDLAGRIPAREETVEFLTDKSDTKRARVIDKLVNSEGFTSRMFNYFGDMLRIADDANKIKYFTYEEWLKKQIAENRPWNVIVREMLSADGNMLQNGATGYLLRDKGMRLDNLSLTLTTFLGANVACAQCHDHPFAEWTQKQFYQMAAFMGATETEMPGGRRMLSGLDRQTAKQARNIMRVNTAMVTDKPDNDMTLPKDYKYEDGKPNEPVKPKLVSWGKEDARTKAYRDATDALRSHKNHEADDRDVFAKWVTSPDNPRFAMTIANRLWKVVFGVGVKEPVTDLDNPDTASNPELLRHLAAEMVRVNFDIRAFMRLLCNTETYQREAVTREIAMGEPYYFPGPILRRMTAEQAWDSCVTLAIGDKVDAFKLQRGDAYAKVMDLKLTTSSPSEVAERVQTVLSERSQLRGLFAKGANAKPGKRPARMRQMQDTEDNGEADFSKPAVMSGLMLARASELPQPERGEHFLRMFGQSDRQIADSNSDEGSIPQVMMLMNGDAQQVLQNPKSKVLSTALAEQTPDAQIQDLYISFLSRNPKPEELADARSALAGGLSPADLTWVLFNSREFIFVQ
ncbi:MAG: DUF1549 and DUF1553 domain-containing protein [Verrucomicrobiaceae bacterium]|nr:DUF1549 and DUF1553 domain-containing protein [Verrucomicrobiaceae bacterium]